jgi:curved DNA-binding protein CbpA
MAATPEHAARVLDVSVTATLKEVHEARREMAFRFHPDCSDDAERANRHMARINAAADTLIAHIKNRASASGKRPEYRDFAGENERRKAPRSTKSDRKAASTSVAVPAPVDRSADRRCMTTAVETPCAARPESGTSRSDRDLLRFATQAYTTVLGQIGGRGHQPTVDCKVMQFA